MRRHLAPFVLAFLSAPAWSGDGRLQVGVGVDMNYEDNVLAAPNDEDGDFYLSGGPRLHAYDERGDFRWDVEYNPMYLKYHEFDGLDDWEHYASGELSWVPSERTRIFGSVDYIDASSFLRLEAVDPVLGDVGVEITNQAVERTTFTAGLSHRLTRRNEVTLSVEHLENDYELLTRQDVAVTGGSAQWLYDWSERDRIGFDLRYSRQEFGFPGIDPTRTDYYNVSAVWQHTFDPTMFLNISAGPALVEPEDADIRVRGRRYPQIVGANGLFGTVAPATCPTLEDGSPFLSPLCFAFPLAAPDELVTLGVIGDTPEGAGNEITYFATATLVKNWKLVRGELQYLRDTSTSGDFGGSTVRDIVIASLDWRVTRRFRAHVDASYQRFESVTEDLGFVAVLRPASFSPFVGEAIGLSPFIIENEREDQIYRARIRLSYDITRRAVCSLSVIWQTSVVDSPPILPIKVDRLIVTLGFTYHFRPIPLGI